MQVLLKKPKRDATQDDLIWRVVMDRTLTNADIGAYMRLQYAQQHPEEAMFYIDEEDPAFCDSLQRLDLAGYLTWLI